MLKHTLQFIFNGSGDLIDKVVPSIKAQSNLTNLIQVVAPIDASYSVFANYDLGDATIKKIKQYLRLTTQKGIDVVDPARPYAQTVAEWNVWEMEISSVILSAISKKHAGNIIVSFDFSDIYYNPLCTNFVGTFGIDPATTIETDLPNIEEAEVGDYYTCNSLVYTSATTGETYTYGEAVRFDGVNWVKGSSFNVIVTTPTQKAAVDPAFYGQPIIANDELLIEQILAALSQNSAAINSTQSQLDEFEDEEEYNLSLKANRYNSVISNDDNTQIPLTIEALDGTDVEALKVTQNDVPIMKLYAHDDGSLYIQNIASLNGSTYGYLNFNDTTGTNINRNRTSGTVLTVENKNSSWASTNRVLDIKNNGSTVCFIDGSGLMSINNSIYGQALLNQGSASYAAVYVQTTGTVINRDVADNNPALQVTQSNAGSTGDIAQFKNSSEVKAKITEAGNVGIGVSNPTEKLEVDGNIVADEIILDGVGVKDFIDDMYTNLTIDTIIPVYNSSTNKLTDSALLYANRNLDLYGNFSILKYSGYDTTPFIKCYNHDVSMFTVNADGKTTMTNDLTVDGDINLTGNISVDGDLLVKGTTTTINTDTIKLEDNIIEVNSGQTGTPLATLKSGLEINRGDLDNFLFIFDELDDRFKVGTSSNLQTVATRLDDGDMTDTVLPYFNATNKRFENSNVTYDSATDTTTVTGDLNVTEDVTIDGLKVKDTLDNLDLDYLQDVTNDTPLDGHVLRYDNVTEKFVNTYLSAEDTTYDNTSSEMSATTVQEAIDEIDNVLDNLDLDYLQDVTIDTPLDGHVLSYDETSEKFVNTQLTAEDIPFDNTSTELSVTNVQEALEEVLAPSYATAIHESLTSEITATNDFEIKDQSGELIKIEGPDKPANLVYNGDFSNGGADWTYYGTKATIVDGRAYFNRPVGGGVVTLQQTNRMIVGNTYYYSFELENILKGSDSYGFFNNNGNPMILQLFNHLPLGKYNVSGIITPIKIGYLYFNTVGGSKYYLDNVEIYDVTEMKNSGVKNDAGISFSNLSNEEIKEQLDIWIENGWPTKIQKIVSKSDNLFDGSFNTLTNLDSEAIIVDDVIPSLDITDTYYIEADNYKKVNTLYHAAGKNLVDWENYSYTNHEDRAYDILSFADKQAWVGKTFTISHNITEGFLQYKVSTSYGSLNIANTLNNTWTFTVQQSWVDNSYKLHIGYNIGYTKLYTDLYPLLEEGITATTYEAYVKPKKIVNLSELVYAEVLPEALTDEQYFDMIVNQELDNVPLRESNLIAVEAGASYKLIKASDAEATHKLVEYTANNELIKVTDMVYTDGKSQVLIMDENTSKVKIVSDLLARVPCYFPNPTFEGTSLAGIGRNSSPTLAIEDGCLKITNTSTSPGNIYVYNNLNPAREYYTAFSYKPYRAIGCGIYLYTTATSGRYVSRPAGIANVFNKDSYMFSGAAFIGHYPDGTSGGGGAATVGASSYMEYVFTYDITQMKNSGVVNDNGTLFSRLTNDEIQNQMDTWIEVGFPDQVIHALYPNGADTALAFKYNDADDVFRALESDEMEINLELRNGEYWENNYVVKQNGNAQYFPLDNTISAWNYGQLEAQYTSGLPTDFHFTYPLNTASQIITTSNYLQEARKQLDYVTNGYNAIAEQLGDMLDEDTYNSIVGITSEKFKYYELDGISTGSRLKIVGTGQSIQNLMDPDAVPVSYTQSGVTISYDSATGIYTVDGTFTNPTAQNFDLMTAFNINLPVGTAAQLMRYYVGGTVDLNGSYIGYVLVGSGASHRINENSESLYDPYINNSGNINAVSNVLYFQVWKQGISFDNFQFKIGIYEGLKLQPFVIPGSTPARSNVTIYNENENMLDLPTSFTVGDETSDIFISYDALSQEFLVTGTATSTRDISLTKSFPAVTGDRFSIKRVYQAGDVKDVGGVLPKIKLTNSALASVVENTIYEKIADTEETILPTDITFNTGTSQIDSNLYLKLGVTSGQVFEDYRFRLMIHDNSIDIGYVPYEKFEVGTVIVGKDETAELEFEAINYGILKFVAETDTLNLLYGNTLADLSRSTLEYNSGIASPTRKITELDERISLVDGTFKDKVIAIWGDSRESNNPTSDPSGVGDQLDTSWPALLAKKTGATVYNFGLSGGCWTENTVQQDAAAAIVNRISTQDTTASADIIIISCMNDFKLASPLGSSATSNKTKTTFYGAMRTTYETLATKYPGKKILLVLPQKRYDENVNYGGGSYYHYLKAQVEVANEYGIPIVDLYHNMPGVKNTSFYTTYMLNDTHWNATGNDRVAELVMKELLGNGNKGSMDIIPSIPTTDGTYTLQVTLTGGVPTFSWVSST